VFRSGSSVRFARFLACKEGRLIPRGRVHCNDLWSELRSSFIANSTTEIRDRPESS
jgi:hypothetical protein